MTCGAVIITTAQLHSANIRLNQVVNLTCTRVPQGSIEAAFRICSLK